MKYLITGTSSGLGFELASQLIRTNNVIGISRNVGKFKKFSKLKHFNFIPFNLGFIEDEFKYSNFKKKLIEKISSDDFILILNAAQFYSGEIRLSVSQVKDMFTINLFSIMNFIENLKKLNLKRILIVNSISGLVGNPNQHEYVSSKHALMGYTKSLIKEAKNSNFDVMCINPGGIKTELWDDYSNIDTSSFIEPKELARIIISLLDTKQKLFIESMVILPSDDV